MTYIIILLAIIALSEILRWVVTYSPKSKKRYFTEKREGVKKMTWDLEFKVFKTRELREAVRKRYDDASASKYLTEEQIKNWPADKPVEDKKRLEDDVIRFDRDIERYKEQMNQLDLEMDGSKPTNEYPEGVAGVNDQIDSLRELNEMLRDWIKRI